MLKNYHGNLIQSGGVGVSRMAELRITIPERVLQEFPDVAWPKIAERAVLEEFRQLATLKLFDEFFKHSYRRRMPEPGQRGKQSGALTNRAGITDEVAQPMRLVVEVAPSPLPQKHSFLYIN
jgi:hypothetical protein